jgi:hypothetical protein
VRALLAEVQHNQPVPPVALSLPPGQNTLWPEVQIPANFDPRQRRRSLAIIKFGAGQLAAPASDTPLRVRHNDSLSLFHNNEGLYCSLGENRPECGYPYDRYTAPFQDLPTGTQRIQTERVDIWFQNLPFFAVSFHSTSFTYFLFLLIALLKSGKTPTGK